jgi:pimeloyl-ACP methyl ester carboxylesterase
VIQIGATRLETRWAAPATARPTLVFLHEGLGCAEGWRFFPHKLAAATDSGAFVYSRWGYGGSDARPAPWPPGFLDEEATSLPAVLAAAEIREPILIGHSDGASIALAAAAAGLPVRALGLLSPHTFVEPLTTRTIAAFRDAWPTSWLRDRLARHHGDKTDALVSAWCDVWLSRSFATWRLRGLERINCPVLSIQGQADPYGTAAHVYEIEQAVLGARTLLLPGCGHHPHFERPEETLAALADFIRAL